VLENREGQGKMMQHFLDASSDQLETWFSRHGQPSYRLDQVRQWLFEQRASEFTEMTNLPESLRGLLGEHFLIWSSQIAQHHQSNDGTEKLLFKLAGGGTIESVLLRDGQRRTICISTQVGCAMGCVFCASGLNGVERNLTSGEIVEQMLRLAQLLPAEERLSHIVVMGMGEPLANLDSLLPALEIAASEKGLGISARRITISTVGLPEAIDRLTARNARFHLAVSLHAPDDELRNELVPVNRNIGLDRILQSADRYFDVSGRRLTFEYVLLRGINDTIAHAHRLVGLLRGRSALLNLIPYNPVVGLPYKTPGTGDLGKFREVLQASGLTVKVRQRKGDKINAACGQLRRVMSTDDHFEGMPSQ